MKLLLDQVCHGRPSSIWRRWAFRLTTWATSVWRAATDQAILVEARRKQACIVTLDADFHSLLALSGAREPSVIRIRIEGLKGDQLARLLSQVLAGAASELAAGATVSVTRRRIRIRLLP